MKKRNTPDFDLAVKIMMRTLNVSMVLAIALTLFALWAGGYFER